MNAEQKQDAKQRMKKIAGQLAGIERMIEEDRYCVDVLTQISAVRAALGKVSNLLLGAHLETCVVSAFESPQRKQREEKLAELQKLFDKHCGC